jgi:hypothetical protein
LELGLRTVGSEREPKDPDDEREDRDQREEDLVRDAAGEEGPVVVEEALDRPASPPKRDGYDAASPFGADFSDFAPGLSSDFDSFLPSDFVSVPPPVSLFGAGRLSVLYHPDPLNTIAGAVKSRRGRRPQLGHFSNGGSLNDWTDEKLWPQWSQ